MLLSRNWLADHVDLAGVAPAELAELLTMRTALIEGFVDQGAALNGVVVGKVLTCGPHPDADRLAVCSVDHGTGEPAEVVCGAPNVAAGQTILYAPVGTRLPNGLKLKKAKIRGVISYGMICAEDELGLGTDHDGIIELPAGPAAGTPIGELPGVCDVIFEIDNQSVTHRPDLWGHYGFARELAAILGRPLKPLALDTDLKSSEPGSGPDVVAIDRDDDEGCPLYAGLCLQGAPQPSPDWMRRRLVACGMRPLGLFVDVSNYVMLELGQPTHPFDRDRLAGDRIVVRRAASGEVLRTLDEVDRVLTPEDVVIADGERGVALAGIMGGGETEVSEGTQRLLLESAHFDAVRVRRTASRLALRTEAVARFEKALDPALVEAAVRRYARLVREHGEGVVIAEAFALSGTAATPSRVIDLPADMVGRLLGCDVPREEVETVLRSVGFETRPAADGALAVSVPSWRAARDVTLPVDLVEEVGRLRGYDAVPTAHPAGPLLVGRRDPVCAMEDALRDVLCGNCAFTETLAYSMVSDGALAAAGWTDTDALPRLSRPLQQDSSRLRPSAAPGLISHLEEWLRRQPEVRVFEVGRAFRMDDGDVHETREVMALLATRDGEALQLLATLKGVAQRALAAVGTATPMWALAPAGSNAPWLHPQQTSTLNIDGVTVGSLGSISPVVLSRLGVTGEAALLVLDPVSLAATERTTTRFTAIGRFPPVRIDLAFVAGAELSAAGLAEAIQAAGPRTLRSVEAFEVYRGKPLAAEERSLAYHLVFEARDRTLTDDDVANARERIVAAVEKLGARLR